MQENDETLTEYIKENGKQKAIVYFYHSVKDDGDLDIKKQAEWKFEDNTQYYFHGMLLRYDDPGNINFGYVGAVLFDVNVLCFGAGLNQIKNYGFRYGNFFTFFDDPRDQEMIKKGYKFYMDGVWINE